MRHIIVAALVVVVINAQLTWWIVFVLRLNRSHLELEVLDIDTDEAWTENYGERIPVVEYEGRTICQYTLDSDAIRSIIAALPGS